MIALKIVKNIKNIFGNCVIYNFKIVLQLFFIFLHFLNGRSHFFYFSMCVLNFCKIKTNISFHTTKCCLQIFCSISSTFTEIDSNDWLPTLANDFAKSFSLMNMIYRNKITLKYCWNTLYEVVISAACVVKGNVIRPCVLKRTYRHNLYEALNVNWLIPSSDRRKHMVKLQQ